MGKVYKLIGRKKTFTIGVLVQGVASLALMVIKICNNVIFKWLSKETAYLMYPTVILMGIS
jgi:hypothetical protein